MGAIKPSPNELNREDALQCARFAEQAERYEEMVAYMKRIVDLGIPGDDLTVEERNLISVGYKNMMSVRRTAWRQIVSAQSNKETQDKVKEWKEAHPEDSESETPYEKMSNEYKQTIASELFGLIDEVSNDIVKKYVTGPQKANDAEVMVFFHKMEGDYNRYGAEITSDDQRAQYKEKARSAYEQAQKLAESLKQTNPIRLGLALNFSVFYYEICEQKVEASELAQAAFDNAIELLDGLDEEAYRDSTLIMQLLKDNLSLWAGDDEDQ